jgi:hypothetical protein
MTRATGSARSYGALDLVSQFTALGVAVVEHALSQSDLAAMDVSFPRLGPRVAGARTSAFVQDVQAWFADHDGLRGLAAHLLQGPAQLTRLQAFDKSAGSNWFVPWHQDRAENGQERGLDMLERMVALRIHLDDCDETHGPLEVLPGSHLSGRLTASDIAILTANTPPLLCLVTRGDIVAMRPLLLHRSQRASKPAARRVLHLEYTSVASPASLRPV